MFDLQSRFIFPTHAVPECGPLPPGAATLSLGTPDGERLAGIHIPADEPGPEKLAIIGFGGNAWNGQDVAEYLHGLFPDAEVVAFHYRGYEPSTGEPSAQALIADAPLIYDLVANRLKPNRVVTVGFSIGSGVAATLATSRQVHGLILVTPFDSMKAVAEGMYPWLPIGRFFDHEIDAAEAIRQAKVPVAIIAAERDQIIPSERTDALREVVPDLRFDRTIDRAGHNDIYARSDFHAAMREALDVLAGQPNSGTR